MEEIKWKIQLNEQQEKTRQENIAFCLHDAFVLNFLKENGLNESFVKEHSAKLKQWAENKAICAKCQGLDHCQFDHHRFVPSARRQIGRRFRRHHRRRLERLRQDEGKGLGEGHNLAYIRVRHRVPLPGLDNLGRLLDLCRRSRFIGQLLAINQSAPTGAFFFGAKYFSFPMVQFFSDGR